MSGRTLSFLILAMITGIILGYQHFISPWYALIPVSIALILFLTGIVADRITRLGNNRIINGAIAVLLFLSIGLFSASINRPSLSGFEDGKYSFKGMVMDYTPMTYGDKLLVELNDLSPSTYNESKTSPEIKNVKAIIILIDASNLTVGDYLEGTADFTSIHTPGNYYNKDYTRYLEGKGILVSGFVAANNYTVRPSSSSLTPWLYRQRLNLEGIIESTPLQQETKNFIISVLLGDKTYFSNDDRISFSDAGVSHIFAVSGFHVSLIALFLLGILSLFFQGTLKKWKYLLCIPIMWLYILLVGASPSTCRAGIMLTIGLTALFLQRKNNPLLALGWTVILILAFFPSSLMDVGFQLSVVCVGSLILIAQPLNFVRHRQHPLLFKIVSLLLVAMVASFSTWIICAFYFHRFSLMFIPLNLIAVPLLPIYLLIVLTYVSLSFIGIDIHFLRILSDRLYEAFHSGASFLSSISSPLDNIYPSGYTVILWVLALICIAWLIQKPKSIKRISFAAGSLAIALVSLMVISQSLPQGFIIQKNSKEATILSYRNGKENELTLPEYNSVSVKIDGKNILALRTDSLTWETRRVLPSADIVIICAGCKDVTGIFTSLKDDVLIVTHPTLHWRYDREIIKKAGEMNTAAHSLRYDGPLHVFSVL